VGRDTAVGIATRYGLDGPGPNPGGGEIFRNVYTGPGVPPSLLYVYRVFPGVKVAGAWRRSSTSSSTEVQESGEL
jgi:hypothetical protein